MFPWADGDSLRDFWRSSPTQKPTKEVILQTIVQLRGLADALDRLHYFNDGNLETQITESTGAMDLPVGPKMIVQNDDGEYEDVVHKESIRHGDLKPENVLNFQNDKTGLGTLKIADMGLAKRHVVATSDRSYRTSTRFGTALYEAPETTTELQGRSRLYDIWSMGCIAFEFIIWNLYGNEELENFYNQINGDSQYGGQYFEIPAVIPRRAELHPVVRRWMDYIQNKDPECSQDSAIRDLLIMVRTKLLVIPLPPGRASSFTPNQGFLVPGVGETVTKYRTTARGFREALDEILSKVERPGYLLTGTGRMNVQPPLPKSTNLLSPNVAQRKEIRMDGLGALKPGSPLRPGDGITGIYNDVVGFVTLASREVPFMYHCRD
jgi:serine/threonine protein kinase